jgi:hypothetical protein
VDEVKTTVFTETIAGPGLDELDEARRRCDRPGAEGGLSFWDLLSLRDKERALEEPGGMPRIVSEHQIP